MFIFLISERKGIGVELAVGKSVINQIYSFGKMQLPPFVHYGKCLYALTGTIIFRQELLYLIGYNSVCYTNIIPEMV